MEQNKKLHPALAALIVIALIGIVASVVIVVNNNNANNDAALDTTQTVSDAGGNAPDTSTDTSEYKDGTYSATGTYLSPGGRESIELTVVIKDGVITESTVKANASDTEAQEYQELFTDNYKTLVVGKSVNGLSLSRVAGSSLTSNGFNNALDNIRDDARV